MIQLVECQDPIYQQLIDIGFDEYDLETEIGEGWTTHMLRQQAIQDGWFSED